MFYYMVVTRNTAAQSTSTTKRISNVNESDDDIGDFLASKVAAGHSKFTSVLIDTL